MIRVLIADDHTLVREALTQMLKTEPDLEVVEQAANAEQAIERCKLLAPDVVLMDIHMPHGSEGIEATRSIVAQSPGTKVIMLTMERQDEYLFEAIKAGAKGYLLKNTNSEELLSAIRDVAGGEATLSPLMAKKILDEFRKLGRHESGAEPYELLSEREREILSLVSQGGSNHEIGKRLGISEKTVRNRLSVIYNKLHINNRTQAALLTLRHEHFMPDEKS